VADPDDCTRVRRGSGVMLSAAVQGEELPLGVWGAKPPEAGVLMHFV